LTRIRCGSPGLNAEEPHRSLKRSLTCLDLVVIGVAQIIGAGILVISGVGVKIAGPGIILSFLDPLAKNSRPRSNCR